MEYHIPLFPHRYKYLGAILMLVSLFLGWLYFFGGKPEVFNIKVFALVSVYLERRFFVVASTNVLDELAAILFISGIAVFSFSKEASEKDVYSYFRIRAHITALQLTLSVWILSFLLVYGTAIFVISSLIFILYFVFYNSVFRYLVIKYKSKGKTG